MSSNESNSSSTNDSTQDSLLPAILKVENVIVPVKIDISYLGARYVDTICWDIYSPISCSEFAYKTCNDKNLPFGFQMKIAMQLAEQVQAFKTIISSLKQSFLANIPSIQKLKKPIAMNIGVRLNSLDYADKFSWDPMNDFITPEIFASITCTDLGLPLEIQSAIAHKIREILFRNMISWLDDPNGFIVVDVVDEFNMKPSEVKVSLVPQAQVVEMTNNLWKRAKPSSFEELATIPQPMLPTNRDTNSGIWKKSI